MDEETRGIIYYTYGEVCYTGEEYRIHRRVFMSESDAYGCWIMYIKGGGYATDILGFRSLQLEEKSILKVISRHYEAFEQSLNGELYLSKINNINYHEDYFVKLFDRLHSEECTLDDLYAYADERYQLSDLPALKVMNVKVKGTKEVNSVEIKSESREALEEVLRLLKKNDKVIEG